MRVDIVLHDIRIRGSNDNLPLREAGLRISDHHLRVQRIHDVSVRCPCDRDNRRIIFIHVRLCDIVDRDESLQMTLRIRNRQGEDVLRVHQIPCILDRNLRIDPRCPADLQILHPRPDILDEQRLRDMKIVQHELCLSRHGTRPACHILVSPIRLFKLFLQICIGNRRTD